MCLECLWSKLPFTDVYYVVAVLFTDVYGTRATTERFLSRSVGKVLTEMTRVKVEGEVFLLGA
jgi:hypothetical protein